MAQPKNINNAILDVLSSIDAKLDKSAESVSKLNTNLQGMAQTGVVSEKEYESFSKLFGVLAKGITSLVKSFLAKGITSLVKSLEKVSPKTGEKFKNLILSIGESIEEFFSKVDEKQVKAFADMMSGLGKGIFLYALAMTASLPFLILAPISAFLFGISLRILFKSMGAVGANEEEAYQKLVVMIVLLDFAKGIMLYGLAMLVVTILAPAMLIGAFIFGLSIRILMATMGVVGDTNEAADKLIVMIVILDMAKGIMLYGLAMLVVTILAPVMLIGALVFGLSVRLLLWVMGAAGDNAKQTAKGMSSILDMAKGIMLFALAMLVVSILFIPVLFGAVIVGVAIRLLLWIMGASGDDADKTAKGIKSILDLSKGILLFALGLTLVAILFIPVLLGAVIFAVAIWIISFGLEYVQSKEAKQGVRNLLILGLAILLYALVFALFDAIVTWGALLKVGVTLAGIALIMWFVGKKAKEIEKGAIAMTIAAAPILLIAIAMAIWKSAEVDWMDIAKLAATVVVIGLIGAIAGLGPIPAFIMAGSAALIVAGAAILLIAVAMAIWTAADVGWEDVGILGATVLMIGVEMALLGLASPFILAGAFAMGVAAIPLVLITGSLAVFKSIGWKEADGDMLINALDSVVAGFLGGRMPGGIFAMIAFAAKAAARAVLMLVTIPPFILAGLALIPIAKSLKMFKEAKWTPADSVNMEGVMAAIISAFSLPGDYARQKELGIYTNPFMLMMGIWALKDAGSTMASLAEGVQAFANLTVPIYGWVDAEDGSGGSLQIVEKRQMSAGDFKLAGEGMATVIGAIAAPLAAVGRLEAGGSSGNPILDAIFAGNFVSKGVSALRNAGDTIVGLAEGVQSFANLTIPVYGLVTSTDEQGNENTKLEVIERKTMTTTDIQLASDNISLVIGVVAEALAEVGRTEANSSGWFSGGFVSRGAKALAGVGDNIKAIADTVKGYADLTIFPMELINAGTKDAKLVPGKPIKLTNADLEAAARSLSKVLGIVVDAVAQVGKDEADTKGWFSGGFVSKGRDALGNIGLNIKAIADAVIGFATASFTPMGPDKDGNLVAIGPSVRLGKTELKAAATALGEVISLMGWEVYWFGKDFSNKMWALEAAVEANNVVTDVVSKVQGAIKKMEKITMDVATEYVAKMNMIFTGVYNIFSPENAPGAATSAIFFNFFSKKMTMIAENADGIQGAGKGFGDMATASTKWVSSINKIDMKRSNSAKWLIKSMTVPDAWKGSKIIASSTVKLKEQINGIDIDRLKILNSLMQALATLGSTDVGLDKLGEEIGNGMKEGFELLAEYLAELISQGAGGGGGGMLSGITDSVMGAVGLGGAPAAPGAAAAPGAPPAPPAGDIVKQLKQALMNTLLTVKIKE